MTYWYIAAVLDLALALLGIALTLKKRVPPRPGELCRLGETKMTLLLGALMAIVSVLMLWMKYRDPSIGGEGSGGWLFAALISVLCMAGAAFTLPFTCVKTVVAFEDRISCISWLGKEKSIRWKEISGMQGSMLSKAVTINARDGSSIKVNGDPGQYRKFVEQVKDLIKPAQGKELLDQLESRMRL